MKKLFFIAAFTVGSLSMISCTAEAVEDVTPTNATSVSADGEPANTPIVIPPLPPKKP